MDGRDIAADLGDGLVEFGQAAAGDVDERSFFNEALGGGETYPAAAARDDGDLSFKFRHRGVPSFKVGRPVSGLLQDGALPDGGGCGSGWCEPAQTEHMPPSTSSSLPATKLLSSDARNSIAAAISSGRAMRPRRPAALGPEGLPASKSALLASSLACRGLRSFEVAGTARRLRRPLDDLR